MSNNIPSNYSLKSDTGVILLSLTASGECGFVYYTELKEIYSKKEYSIGMQDIRQERDWQKTNACPSKPDDYFGKLVTLELPAGIYQLHRIEWLSKYSRVFSENEMNIKFKVQAGKINYLGNLHFHVLKKSFIYGVENMRARDIPLFLKKYTQFRPADIIINLIKLKSVNVLST